MKTLSVSYWRSMVELEGIKHNTTFEYSLEKQREITEKALDSGYNVMIRLMPVIDRDEPNVTILIDLGRFTQS